jgi:hypothetical protein
MFLLLSLLGTSVLVRLQLATSDGTIVVDYNKPLRALDPLAIGVDISGYFYPDVFANDRVEQQKIKTLSIKYMRMHLMYTSSGDPTSKIICAGDGCDTRWTGDQWINAIKQIGAEPVITVNTSPSIDAANLVKHFNRDTHNPVHYWIIGNEPNADGTPAENYSTVFNQDYDAMKAIDPTIKIGGGAVAWYDHNWLKHFLQNSGSRVDFVDFHGYAQQGTTPGDYNKLFQLADGYGKSIVDLRALIQATVPSRATQIGIEVGEWELDWGGSAQNNSTFHAVWAATVLGNILKTGGRSLFYADKGNLLYGSHHTFKDAKGHTITVSPDDTNPAYHGIGMFSGEGLFQHFGSTMVNATTTLPNIEVFASDHARSIVVINKDPSTPRKAAFNLKGVTSTIVEVWQKDQSTPFPNPPEKQDAINVQNGTFTYLLPPFSITTFVLKNA